MGSCLAGKLQGPPVTHGVEKGVPVSELVGSSVGVGSGCANETPPPTEWLKHGYFLSSAEEKSTIKVLAGFVSSEPSLPGLQTVPFSRCVPTTCLCSCRKSSGVSSFSSEDTSPMALRPYPYDLA